MDYFHYILFIVAPVLLLLMFLDLFYRQKMMWYLKEHHPKQFNDIFAGSIIPTGSLLERHYINELFFIVSKLKIKDPIVVSYVKRIRIVLLLLVSIFGAVFVLGLASMLGSAIYQAIVNLRNI
jgi:hypothetical protein